MTLTHRLLLVGFAALVGAMPASPEARGSGSRSFVAVPKIGNAELRLPSTVAWQSTANSNGGYTVALKADVDAQSVLSDIRNLSAKALDRDTPCGDLVKVRSASAKLTGPRALKYDLRFRYVKRVCAASYPVELPAEVTCSAKIAVSAQRAIVMIDVQGATTPPCRIVGLYQSVSDAIYALVGVDVFKRHSIDLASLLPPEFKGVKIDVRSIAFDLPPARPVAHISGESTMSRVQFETLIANLEATAPRVN